MTNVKWNKVTSLEKKIRNYIKTFLKAAKKNVLRCINVVTPNLLKWTFMPSDIFKGAVWLKNSRVYENLKIIWAMQNKSLFCFVYGKSLLLTASPWLGDLLYPAGCAAQERLERSETTSRCHCHCRNVTEKNFRKTLCVCQQCLVAYNIKRVSRLPHVLNFCLPQVNSLVA